MISPRSGDRGEGVGSLLGRLVLPGGSVAQIRMHELIEMRYLFESALLVDSSDAETLLGVKASSLEVMIADTLRDHL